MWIALLISLSSFGLLPTFSYAADVVEVTEIEYLRRSAIDSFNLKDYEKAEKQFFGVIAMDWKSPLAIYSTDHLKKILTLRGDIERAKQEFQNLEATGKWTPRKLDAGAAELLTKLKLPGKLQENLSQLFKLGGLLAARTSLVGVVLDQLGYGDAGNYWMSKVDNLVQESQEKTQTESRKLISTRPLEHRYTPLFTHAHYPEVEAKALQFIPFVQEQADSATEDPILQQQLEKTWIIHHLKAAYLSAYDTNAVLQSRTSSSLPPRTSHRRSMDPLYSIRLESEVHPARPWSFGGSYSLISDTRNHDDLIDYESRSNILEVTTTWWNKHDVEIRGRYGFAFNTYGSARTDLTEKSFGPSLQILKSWNRRYRTEFAYSFNRNLDPSERRGGEHVFSTTYAYPGKSNRLQPFATYAYSRGLNLSPTTNSLTHTLSLGTVSLIASRSVLKLSTELAWTHLPYASTDERDFSKSVILRGAFPLGRSAFTFLVNGSFIDQTSNLASAEYQRYLIGAGLSLVLGE